MWDIVKSYNPVISIILIWFVSAILIKRMVRFIASDIERFNGIIWSKTTKIWMTEDMKKAKWPEMMATTSRIEISNFFKETL